MKRQKDKTDYNRKVKIDGSLEARFLATPAWYGISDYQDISDNVWSKERWAWNIYGAILCEMAEGHDWEVSKWTKEVCGVIFVAKLHSSVVRQKATVSAQNDRHKSNKTRSSTFRHTHNLSR